MHSVCVYLSNFPVKPTITTQPMFQVSQATNNVTFTCAANANPRALIQWIFNGNVLRSVVSMPSKRSLMENGGKLLDKMHLAE